jgi:hypothetical protein
MAADMFHSSVFTAELLRLMRLKDCFPEDWTDEEEERYAHPNSLH